MLSIDLIPHFKEVIYFHLTLNNMKVTFLRGTKCSWDWDSHSKSTFGLWTVAIRQIHLNHMIHFGFKTQNKMSLFFVQALTRESSCWCWAQQWSDDGRLTQRSSQVDTHSFLGVSLMSPRRLSRAREWILASQKHPPLCCPGLLPRGPAGVLPLHPKPLAAPLCCLWRSFDG